MPVYLDSQFVVAVPESPITDGLLKSLNEWGFTEVFSEGEFSQGSAQVSEQESTETAPGEFGDTGDQDNIQQAEAFYVSFQKYVKNLLQFLPIKNDLHYNSIADELNSVCDFMRVNRHFLMRTQWLTNTFQEDNEMAVHAARSTILAIIIGINLKLQKHRLIEVGASALLHEIGMIKLPSELFSKKHPLAEQEQKLIFAHPILGYNILNSFDLPLTICLAALEHHERENGTGYPKKKTEEKISFYAKITAVVCSYESILSNRPHKDPMDSHMGIIELLKNEGKQYDDTIIRALVYSLAIYPIGLYVLLSNGKKGQVVDANSKNPRFPVVEVFDDPPNDKKTIMRTAPDTCTVVRPLAPEEIKG